MKVIMLGGKAGAGKDTAYKILKEFCDIKRFAFADALKNIAFDIGWDGLKNEKGRKLLQDIGRVAREYNKDVWANIVATEIELWEDAMDYAIITDFRFPNEYDVMKKQFNNVITVNIYGRQAKLGNTGHDISEHSLEKFNFDYVIENRGTLDDYKSELIKLIERIG